MLTIFSHVHISISRQQECDKLLCYSDPGGGLESPEVESSDAEPTQSMVMESDASKTRHVGVGVGVLGSEHSTASNQSTTPHKQPTVEIHHPLKLDAKSSQVSSHSPISLQKMMDNYFPKSSGHYMGEMQNGGSMQRQKYSSQRNNLYIFRENVNYTIFPIFRMPD